MASVEEICDVFFKLEEKYDLNQKQINGCYFWQLIRIYLYYHIARQLKTLGTAQQKKLSLFDKINSFIPFIKNSLLSSPFKGNESLDFIIFDHPRKSFFKGEFRDIYTYFLVDFLKDNYSFEVMEAPYLNRHTAVKKSYVRYTDRIELGSYIYKKFHNVNFCDEQRKLILDVEKDLYDEFGLKISLGEIIAGHILNFRYDYGKYLELFEKRKPEKIFVVVAYENQAVVAAAKDLGIEVIEIQHGTISDYHLGYSYPNSSEIRYFPDKILTFGDYWINRKTSPISGDNIVPVGFAYFEEQSKDFTSNTKDPKKILFISQGVIGRQLSKLAYETALKLNDYEIIYKLHPGEYETWRNYDDLVKASCLNNFHVVDNSKISLYKLFAESTYQVGAFSTGIYEGLMFNCKTFILDVSGIEYINDLIDEGYVFKISDADDLINNLKSFKPKNYDKNFFFKNLDLNLLKKVIDSE